MLSNVLLLIILSIIIFFIVILFISFQQPPEKKESIILEPEMGIPKLQCMTQAVECNPSNPNNGDDDCKQKCFRQDLKCTQVKIPDSKKDVYGSVAGICAPPDVKTNCKNGILTWTANEETMEWDCICPYPTIAGANNCEVNADICDGKTQSFDWNINSDKNPYYSNCTCPSGFIQYDKYHSSGPICIPENLKLWYYKSYGSVFTSDDGKYKVLLDLDILDKTLNSNNTENKNKNPNAKQIKFTNELGTSFYISTDIIALFLQYYNVTNFEKN